MEAFEKMPPPPPDTDNTAAVAELRKLRERLRQNHRNNYHEDFIQIDDFTYGTPLISYWDDKTTLKIGKFCSIAGGVEILLGGEHRTDWISTYPFNAFIENYKYIKGHPHTKGNIIIGNDVWIASNSKIMSGVTIGNGCVIAANAVVTKDMPYYSICGGIPAKIIKQRFSDKIIKKLEEIKWWDWSDEHICKVIPLLQSNAIEALIQYYDKVRNNTI
ncbi:MAG: CatB-related O-acetyltransferase [Treponema sp.]|nr:CatB-related O-acetyltransferase [Treponema sp.]